MARYITAYAIMKSEVNGDLTGLSLDYNSIHADMEHVRNSMVDGDVLRKIRINYGHDVNNYDYFGYGFKNPSQKLIVHSIQETPAQTRLRGGEGKTYPVRIIIDTTPL